MFLVKKQFALIGYPLAHSISPFIHRRLFDISGVSAEYDLLEISPDKLRSSLPILKKLAGYNITIPHKEVMVSLVDKVCEKDALYGCINTVSNVGCSCGYNTDAYGFLKALDFEGLHLSGSVTILGCGGAARVFCFEAVLAECDVTIAVRQQSLAKALRLLEDVKNVTGQTIQITTLDNLPAKINLLINATPIGMYPNCNQMPLLPTQLENCKAVFDVIYNPKETMLMKHAKSYGIQVVSGLSMLIYQAVNSQKVWTGAVITQDDILQLMAYVNRMLNNIKYSGDSSLLT